MSPSIEADTMLAEMGMVMNQPWDARDVFLTFVMWTVMMVAMVTATAFPVLFLFAGAQARRFPAGVHLWSLPRLRAAP